MTDAYARMSFEEMAHVLLRHGTRGLDLIGKGNRQPRENGEKNRYTPEQKKKTCEFRERYTWREMKKLTDGIVQGNAIHPQNTQSYTQARSITGAREESVAKEKKKSRFA